MTINIYGNNTCAPCGIIKRKLDKLSISYKYFNLDSDLISLTKSKPPSKNKVTRTNCPISKSPATKATPSQDSTLTLSNASSKNTVPTAPP